MTQIMATDCRRQKDDPSPVAGISSWDAVWMRSAMEWALQNGWMKMAYTDDASSIRSALEQLTRAAELLNKPKV